MLEQIYLNKITKRYLDFYLLITYIPNLIDWMLVSIAAILDIQQKKVIR
jgi:hypothetical protein